MGLVDAGVLSGIGQGLSKGFSDAAQIIMQDKLQKDRSKTALDMESMRQQHEDLRQERTIEAQKAYQDRGLSHAEKMQREGFANTLTVHNLDNDLRMLLEDKRYLHDTETQTRAQVLQREIESARLSQAKEIAENSLKSHEKISDEDRASRLTLAKMAIEAQAKKGQLIPKEDGTVMLLRENGESEILNDPSTGKPFKGIRDLPASAKAMGEVISTMIKGNDYLMKNPMLLRPEREALKAENDKLYKNMQTLFGLEGKLGTKEAAEGLKTLSDAQIKSILSDNAPRLKTPEDYARLAEDVRKMGFDPSGLLQQSGASAPASSTETPKASPPPFSLLAPGVTREGGMVSVPGPNADQQQQMEAALAASKQPQAVPAPTEAPSPTAVAGMSATSGMTAMSGPTAVPGLTAAPGMTAVPGPQAVAGPQAVSGPTATSGPISIEGVADPSSELPTPQTSQSETPEGPVYNGLVGGKTEKAADRSLTPKDLAELLTKDQKAKISSMVARIQSPGVKEKPPTRQDLQDLLIKTFGPIYAKNNQSPKELVEDVRELMKELLPSQKDMSGNNYKYKVPS